MGLLTSVKDQLWEARTSITRSSMLAPVGRSALAALSWSLRHTPFQSKSRRVREARYLNAGCGKVAKPAFVNLDFTWQPGVDLVWDLRWNLPFRDNTLQGIYTEHCLEHLPRALVTDHVLKEFLRVLVPAGLIRIIVPDAGTYAKLYVQSLSDANVTFPTISPEGLRTPMMHVNQCFRYHGHQYAYDFETLKLFVGDAGFVDIHQRSFLQGEDPVLLVELAATSARIAISRSPKARALCWDWERMNEYQLYRRSTYGLQSLGSFNTGDGGEECLTCFRRLPLMLSWFI